VNWKFKAAIQNVLGGLPPVLTNPVYYGLQRTCGGLRSATPFSRMAAGIEIVRRLQEFDRSVQSAAFLEIGTGHQLNLPLSLWLCGAGQVTTVDLNRYLKERLVLNDITYLRQHEDEAKALFAEFSQHDLFEKRFARLTAAGSLREVFSMTNIRYWAPADASCLALEPDSIDYHISFTVLEHIPAAILKHIFQEGCRLLKPDGLFVHCIDFSDHFAHSDKSVSSVNFLQFSEKQWDRLAGNRYMFHNRLRVDEFHDILQNLGLEILALDATVDEAAADILRNGFPLNERFRDKDCRINAATGAWLVAAPDHTA
jgi:SAM-dependent methyltransferase